jgi:hypothetical protein
MKKLMKWRWKEKYKEQRISKQWLGSLKDKQDWQTLAQTNKRNREDTN